MTPINLWALAFATRARALHSTYCKYSPCRRLSYGSTPFRLRTWESRTRRSTCFWAKATRGARSDVFFKLFERQMDALLHPDYTDEEIRREVRNFGVTENPEDKTLRLEEKGTVYNEMVSSMDQADSRLYRELGLALYGKQHPLAYNSGGDPAALRLLKPEDIRRFHDANYHL